MLAVLSAPSTEHPTRSLRAGESQTGPLGIRHGIAKVHDPCRRFARVKEELRRGRIVTFANMNTLVLGLHRDSPYVPSFDEDMKHYKRRLI